MELIISVTSEGGAQSPESRAVGTDIAAQLQASPHVADVTSAWTAPPTAAPALVSKDGKTGLIVAGITGGESDAQKYTKELTERLVHDRDGVTVRAGGEAMIYVQINGQSEKDLLLMESIAIPLSFLVLVWVFGGLLAAALPLAVGAFAILGSMAVLHAITFVTDVSIFALNLSVAMGLALAIDYTLLIVSRYRDELAAGSERDEALIRTMATAGRTVLFSAIDGRAVDGRDGAVPDVFPEVVRLRGHCGGGVRGRRGDRGGARSDRAARRSAGLAGCAAPVPARYSGVPSRLPSPWRRTSGTGPPNSLCAGRFRSVSRSSRSCYCSARRSSARSGASPTTACCPSSLSAREVGDQMRNDFAVDSARNVTVVIPDATGHNARRTSAATPRELSQVPDVASVSSPAGTFVDGQARRAALGRNGIEGRQRVSDRRQQCAAVLRRLRGAARPAARGEHP